MPGLTARNVSYDMPSRRAVPTWSRSRSGLRAAGDDERLAADEVAIGAAEEIDGAGRLRGQPAAPERDHLVHAGDTRALHADLHLASGDLARAGLALGERLRQACLDVAEGHAVHGNRV